MQYLVFACIISFFFTVYISHTLLVIKLMAAFNQDTVSEWSDMSTYRMLFQWADNVSEWRDMSTYRILFQCNHDNVSEWRDMYYYMHCYLSIKIKDNVSEWRDMYYYMHCYLSEHNKNTTQHVVLAKKKHIIISSKSNLFSPCWPM